MNRTTIIEKFQIPEVAWDIIEEFLLPEEMQVIEKLETEIFNPSDLIAQGYALEEALAFLQKGHSRGVFKRTQDEEGAGLYQIGDFYGRLDIFAVIEDKAYMKLPQEKREALDSWYFETYFASLDFAKGIPTADEVLSLEDTLAFIEGRDDQPYLAHCDCRKLKRGCDQPTFTCITYRTAPNSFVSRGHAWPISKEEAMELVRRTDDMGLIHTVNPGGICNCCGDCCYLFRSARKQGSFGSWPKTPGRIAVDADRCIGCGKCIARCHFHVLDVNGKKARTVNGECVGCGLCASVCPVGALSVQ